MGATEAHTGELAGGVARLGTETAFSVLAKARAMERAGRDVIHLEIGEPDFDTPPHVAEAGIAAMRAGETHYCPAAGIPELREAAAAELTRTRGVDDRPRADARRQRRQAVPLLHHARDLRARRRGRLPRSRLSDLRVGHPLGRRDAGAAAAARGARLQLRARGPRGAPERAHPARHPQLAAEPDRRRHAGGGPRGGGGPHRCRRRPGCSPTRSTRGCTYGDAFASHRQRARDARAHGPARRLLEDVRDDRLALRLCGRARRARRAADALLRQLDLLRAAVRPARRRRGARRAAGRRRRDGGRVPPLAATSSSTASTRCPASPACRRAGRSTSSPTWPTRPSSADELADRLLEEAGVALLAGTAFGAQGADHLRLSYANSQANLTRALERMDAFLRGL